MILARRCKFSLISLCMYAGDITNNTRHLSRRIAFLKISFTHCFPLLYRIHQSELTALESENKLLINQRTIDCSRTMEPVHHLSISSKTLLSKVRKMVPPMLEKFHKGLSVFHIICVLSCSIVCARATRHAIAIVSVCFASSSFSRWWLIGDRTLTISQGSLGESL